MKVTALCPGSFDPITTGHVRLIERAASVFDEVVVCVAENDVKVYTFSAGEREILCRKALAFLRNVRVVRWDGMTADAVDAFGASVIVKGIRNETDFAYETEMARYNVARNPRAETLFLPAEPCWEHVSSTELKRQLRGNPPDVSLIPEAIREEVVRKISWIESKEKENE